MLSLEDLKKIEKEIEMFFQKMGIRVSVEILPQKDLTLPINLKTEDFQILIGEEGKILLQIQHLLNVIFKKKMKQDFYIDIDIGGYKKRKIEYLKELARAVADEVSLTKKEKILEPMPAFERRIIHLELASRPDVTTESIGKEPKRRVVIKPYP